MMHQLFLIKRAEELSPKQYLYAYRENHDDNAPIGKHDTIMPWVKRHLTIDAMWTNVKQHLTKLDEAYIAVSSYTQRFLNSFEAVHRDHYATTCRISNHWVL